MNRLIIITMVFLLVTPALFANVSIPIIIPEAEALDPVTTRHDCHEDTDYQNGTHTQVLGMPCWVRGSPFTKFIMTNYEDRTELQNGHVGVQLNRTDGKMYNYDTYFHDLKSIEVWKV